MSGPNVLDRIDRELARTRASLGAETVEVDVFGGMTKAGWISWAMTQPLGDHLMLLGKSGPLVDTQVKANMRATVEQVRQMSDAEIDAGPCPRFDRWTRKESGA